MNMNLKYLKFKRTTYGDQKKKQELCPDLLIVKMNRNKLLIMYIRREIGYHKIYNTI